MKHINAQEIIDLTNALAHNLYRDGAQPEDRLAYQVGALSGKVRELVQIIKQQDDLIESLMNDCKQLMKDLT